MFVCVLLASPPPPATGHRASTSVRLGTWLAPLPLPTRQVRAALPPAAHKCAVLHTHAAPSTPRVQYADIASVVEAMNCSREVAILALRNAKNNAVDVSYVRRGVSPRASHVLLNPPVFSCVCLVPPGNDSAF